MVLKKVDGKTKVESFIELGDRFNLISEQKSTDHFQVMLSDIFGENLSHSRGVFAIIESWTPGIENVCLYDDDWYFIYTNEGNQFTAIVAPVRK